MVVELAAFFHAELFGNGDFHGADLGGTPQRLEQAVGKAQGEQVLHGLFA